ncbi:hypothetical protein ACFE04_014314 [Oxalis oulophora]
MDICEKVHKAICCFATEKDTDIMEVSHHVHINFDHSSLPDSHRDNPNVHVKDPRVELVHGAVQESSGQLTKIGSTGVHIEDRFTDYINRAKLKIRTMSINDEKKNERDRFSEYIDRSKVKLRSTSSIGGHGRRYSFK